MEKIKVMMSGLPGNMATESAEAIARQDNMELVPYALTEEKFVDQEVEVGGKTIVLVSKEKLLGILSKEKPDVVVDYTHPSVVNENAQFYADNGLNFVMGTTGGDRNALKDSVELSDITAVVAPNMAKQIVLIQSMLKYAADTYPDSFSGYTLEIKESHQVNKADTSGTAKAMVEYFNKLGIPFSLDQIVKYREEDKYDELGVPEEYRAGHGRHTYTLRSPDGKVMIQITHNVDGRSIYADGTVDGVNYLVKKIKEGNKGKMFNMINVLQNS